MATHLSVFSVSPRRVQSCALLLLVAWLPTLAYFGHWNDLAAMLSPGNGSFSSAHGTRDGEHATHCHVNVAGCSDGTSTSNAPGTPPANGAGVRTQPQLGTRAEFVEHVPPGHRDAPATPPPRYVA